MKNKNIEMQQFLSGGGTMGERIRSFNWEDTSLGHPENWPQSLKTCVRIMLTSRQPMFVWWGKELLNIYNDDYVPFLGNKEAGALGVSGQLIWEEIWDSLAPRVQSVFQNQGTFDDALLLLMWRYGYSEETYFKFSYSPIPGEDGEVAGLFCVCNDETNNKLNERALLTQRELGKLGNKNSLKEIYVAAACALEKNNKDLPFVAIYQLDNDCKFAHPVAFAGIDANQTVFPNEIDLTSPTEETLDFCRAASSNEIILTEKKGSRINFPKGFWDTEATHFVHIPITRPGTNCPDAIISAALNPNRRFDESYRQLTLIIADQISLEINKFSIRQKAEENEEIFRKLANSIPQLSWMTDAEGWTYWYNQRWYDYTGTTLEEMQGWGWHTTLHPDLSAGVAERFKKSVETGEAWEDTLLLRGKDGEFRWFLSRALPIRNDNGQIIKWFGTNTDISEQRNAEHALKVAKEQLELTFSNIPAGIYHFDKNGKILYVNEKGAQQIGYQTVEELMKDTDVFKIRKKLDISFEVTDEVGKPLKRDKNSATMALLTSKTAEVVSKLKNRLTGESIWILSRSVPLYDENGELLMVFSTSTDITLQKNAEEALRYRTALLEAQMEANLDGIILIDINGKIISFNKHFIDIWKMPKDIVEDQDDDAVLNFAMTQLVHPEQFIQRVKYLYDHPSKTSIDELEFKDGRIIERHGYPVIGDDGTYFAWSWTFRDITQKKIYEKNIQEREAQLRQITDFMPVKITNSHPDGTIFYFNQSWLDYSWLSDDELKNGDWVKLVHPDDIEETKKRWAHSLESGNNFEMEIRWLNKQGEYQWHLNRSKAIRDENGNILSWIGATTEIQKIKKDVERKDEFIKMVSHELKTPVTSIKGYVQFLLKLLNQDNVKDIDSIPLKSSLIRIDLQVIRLTKLISEILDISRLEESKLQLRKNWFNLNELVTETLQDIRHTNSKINLELKLEVDVQVFGDRDRIGQVIINLITNAIKYSPDNDNVDVRVHQNCQYFINISVKDNGIGIDKKDHQNIFDRFYRVEGKSENIFSGFGIGLFIAKEIMNMHTGFINLYSEKGKGSIFTIRLPLNNNIEV